jgi:hypothetical protein
MRRFSSLHFPKPPDGATESEESDSGGSQKYADKNATSKTIMNALYFLTERCHVLKTETLDAVADRGYFSSLEVLGCHEAGITVTLPKPMMSGAKSEGRFGKQAFAYLPEEVQNSTFARFLGFFDFRLLQQYRGQSGSDPNQWRLPNLTLAVRKRCA